MYIVLQLLSFAVILADRETAQKNISVEDVTLCVVGGWLLVVGSIKKGEELWIDEPIIKL